MLGQVSSPRGPPGRGLHPGGGSARPRLGPRWLALGLVWAVSQHEAAPGAGVHSPLSRKVPRPRHRPGSDGSAGLLPRDQRRGARRARCLCPGAQGVKLERERRHATCRQKLSQDALEMQIRSVFLMAFHFWTLLRSLGSARCSHLPSVSSPFCSSWLPSCPS